MKRIVLLLSVWLSVWPVAASTADSASEEEKYRARRIEMVEEQIEARGIKAPSVLKAMRETPRHEFVPRAGRPLAYDDRPLPIGWGQTISQPYIVAYMTEALALTGKEKVLEVGTGSGYQAAVLAQTAAEVYTIEIVEELKDEAEARLARLGYDNVRVMHGDGYHGWPEAAPFDGIIVTAAADHIPPPLIRQLKIGGRMIIPVGPAWAVQTLILGVRDEKGFQREGLFPVRFVPLVREGK
jgi:protein-L-isoaspartate(D-aspartate) O-methyltransferase